MGAGSDRLVATFKESGRRFDFFVQNRNTMDFRKTDSDVLLLNSYEMLITACSLAGCESINFDSSLTGSFKILTNG